MVIKCGNMFKNLKITASKKIPGILIGIGIVGFISSMVLVGKGTPKALEKIDEKKKELNTDKLTPVETVKATWKCYIPAAAVAAASTGCILGGNQIYLRRHAALAAAYGLTEAALKEYKGKALEVVGEKKEKQIRDAISQDKINNDPVSKKEVILTEKGDYLCYDSITGRYFRTNIDKLKRAENDLSKRLFVEMYISLNEFYDKINVPRVKIGDDIGWNINDGLIGLGYSCQLTDSGEPCLVIDYNVLPRYDFRDLH